MGDQTLDLQCLMLPTCYKWAVKWVKHWWSQANSRAWGSYTQTLSSPPLSCLATVPLFRFPHTIVAASACKVLLHALQVAGPADGQRMVHGFLLCGKAVQKRISKRTFITVGKWTDLLYCMYNQTDWAESVSGNKLLFKITFFFKPETHPHPHPRQWITNLHVFHNHQTQCRHRQCNTVHFSV